MVAATSGTLSTFSTTLAGAREVKLGVAGGGDAKLPTEEKKEEKLQK